VGKISEILAVVSVARDAGGTERKWAGRVPGEVALCFLVLVAFASGISLVDQAPRPGKRKFFKLLF
jgi:hypothetical protein